jgi:thiamine-phosphate diphosphorylase
VNDRPDIAAAVGADGVHLGQEDLPADAAREVFGSRLIVGVSARSLEEALDAEAAGADYVGVGPVYEARATKPDAAEPQGLGLVRAIRERCRIPIIAIGGITADNAPEVMRAGASGVAVISAVVAAEDIAGATAALRDAVYGAVSGSRDSDRE